MGEKVEIFKQRLEWLEQLEAESHQMRELANEVVKGSIAPGTVLGFQEDSNHSGPLKVLGSGTRRDGNVFLFCSTKVASGKTVLTTMDMKDLQEEMVYNQVEILCTTP